MSKINYDAVSVKQRGRCIIFSRTAICTQFEPSGRKCRGKVGNFSVESAARMRRYLSSCKSEYRFMLTLTYPRQYPANGVVVKEHLRRFLQELQRDEARLRTESAHLASFFWFIEFQERGAPHFHIFTNRWLQSELVSNLWYKIVGSGDEKHLRAGTRIERMRENRAGTCSYALKYAQKQSQKAVPAGYENVGRFWGVYGNRETVAAATGFRVETVEETKRQRKLLSLMKELQFRAEKDAVKVMRYPRDEKRGVTCVILRDMKDAKRYQAIISRFHLKMAHLCERIDDDHHHHCMIDPLEVGYNQYVEGVSAW